LLDTFKLKKRYEKKWQKRRFIYSCYKLW
jgi:hypothetical protein